MTQEFIQYKGYRLSEDNISIMSLMETRVIKGRQLPTPFGFAISCLQLIRGLGNLNAQGVPMKTNLSPIVIEENPRLFTADDFVPYKEKFIYKYVPKAYLDFYEKGQFRLGTIDYYQRIENAKICDEFEGFSVLKIRTIERDLYSMIIGGYNQYIFCSTHNDGLDIPNSEMQNAFGDILLKIELEPFIEKIGKMLGAKSSRVHEVKYSNAKLFALSLPEVIIEDGVMFNKTLFKPLASLGFLPCLFIKPHGFNTEKEVRITFELPFDVTGPKDVQDNGLMKYVKILQ
jgi:hypothetical protein